MDTPPNDPTLVEVIEFAFIALVAGLTSGPPPIDPATKKFAPWQLVQAFATAMIFAVGGAGAQQYWGEPFWITGCLTAVGALIGLPIIVAIFRSLADTWSQIVKTKIGGGRGGA